MVVDVRRESELDMKGRWQQDCQQLNALQQQQQQADDAISDMNNAGLLRQQGIQGCGNT